MAVTVCEIVCENGTKTASTADADLNVRFDGLATPKDNGESTMWHMHSSVSIVAQSQWQ